MCYYTINDHSQTTCSRPVVQAVRAFVRGHHRWPRCLVLRVPTALRPSDWILSLITLGHLSLWRRPRCRGRESLVRLGLSWLLLCPPSLAEAAPLSQMSIMGEQILKSLLFDVKMLNLIMTCAAEQIISVRTNQRRI